MATVQHANFIEYGRKGPTRRHSEEDQYEPALSSSGTKVIRHGRKTKVIPPSEYTRIKASLNAKETEEISRRKKEQEKQRLQDLSQVSESLATFKNGRKLDYCIRKQVNSWNNTLSGQRKAKLEAKKVREEREEEVRQQEDIDEAIFKAAERKKSIQHAKTLTFAQTDRVKGFHGALILTEVLKEREVQLQLKKERAQAQALREKISHEKELETLKALDEEERKAATLRSRRKKEVQKYQLAQISRKQEQAAELALEQRDACEENQSVILENQQREQEKARRAAEQNNYMRDCFFAHVKGKQFLADRSAKKEAEEERERQIFNQHKENMSIIQKQKQKEKLNAIQEVQERLSKKLSNELDVILREEEERCQKAVLQADGKREKLHQEKQIKIQRGIEEMKRQQQSQREEAQRQLREKLENEYHEKRAEMAADEQHRQSERDRAKARKDVAIWFRDDHLKRVNERVAKERKEHELDLACDETINKLNRLEEAQFTTYAQEVIDKTLKQGRNPYPMVKAARAGAGGGRGPRFSGIGGLKPSYMTCDETGVQMPNYSQRPSTLELKKKFNLQGHKAKKRLGLLWQL